MWTTLITASGLNKLWPYLLVVLITMVILVAAYWQGKSAGTQSASTERLKDSLNRMAKEAQQRADIEATRSDIARDRLRQRWSKR